MKKTLSRALNIETMRELDRLMGPLVCIPLLIAKGLGDILRIVLGRSKSSSTEYFRNILVMKFFGMGSIILSTPTLRFLKKKFPEARITFLTMAGNREVCENIEYIDNVVSIRSSTLHTFILDTLKALGKLRKVYFDIIIDLEFFSNFGTILIALIHHRLSAGFYTFRYWRRPFYDYSLSYDSTRHMVDLYLKVSRIWSLDRQDTSIYRFPVKEQERLHMEEKLKQKSITEGEKLVIMNPNAGPLSYHRRWPLENFAELLKRMSASGEYRFLIIGSKDDREYLGEFFDTLPPGNNVVDLCGELTWMQLAALMNKAYLYIGNDSGPLHLAASMGIPIICLFGPETPNLYGPCNDRNLILYNGIFCSPCMSAFTYKKIFCTDNLCMKSITINQVWERSKSFMKALEDKQ